MSELGTISLKITRSPSKLLLQCSSRESGKEVSTLEESPTAWVINPSPCMVGKRVHDFPISVVLSSSSQEPDAHQTTGLRGAVHAMPITKQGGSEGGRVDGVTVLCEEGVCRGKGLGLASSDTTPLPDQGHEVRLQAYSKPGRG